MTARRLALAVLPLAVHALLAPGSAAAQSAAGDRLVGEVGLGVYARTEVVRDTGTSTMVLPYVYADWGRVFARVDTLGVKLVPLGLGHLELVGRISTEGWDADRPSLRGLSDRGNPLPVWRGCRVVAEGELFLMNGQVRDSLDGRYFGPLPASAVIGRAIPLYTDEDGDGRFVWRAPTR